ncbi:hypothetical protein BsWGS_21460 [Bradybaena similaris]
MDKLAAKLISLGALIILTITFSVIPYFLVLRRSCSLVSNRQRDMVIASLNCFGGGVFFGTLLLHLMTEGREEFEEYMTKAGWTTEFPLFNIFVACGFFAVAFIEFSMHAHLHRRSSLRVNCSPSEQSQEPGNVVGSQYGAIGGQGKPVQSRTICPDLNQKEDNAHVEHNESDSLLPGRHCESDSLLPGRLSRNHCEADSLLPGRHCESDSLLPGRHCESDSLLPGRLSRNHCEADSLLPRRHSHNHCESDSLLPGRHCESDSLLPGRLSRNHCESAAIKTDCVLVDSDKRSSFTDRNMQGKHVHQNCEIEVTHSDHVAGGSESVAGISDFIGDNPDGLRAFLLLFALSFHTIFDGLAVGVQNVVSEMWQVFTAIAIHKSIIAFCLGLELFKCHPNNPWRAFSWICFFSIMSPIGISIGIGLTSGGIDELARLLSSSILQGLAAGTFLYVTFLEILSLYIGHNCHRKFSHIFFALVGFAFMACVKFLDND